MPGARDTELLNYIRSYDQTPPAPPQCQFNHWGLTVCLPPELAQQCEPPADSVAFAEFMEQMLPHCRVFMSALAGFHRSLHDTLAKQSRTFAGTATKGTDSLTPSGSSNASAIS